MELKSYFLADQGTTDARLNRTFYGIEMRKKLGSLSAEACLNRTFYGIEIYF